MLYICQGAMAPHDTPIRVRECRLVCRLVVTGLDLITTACVAWEPGQEAR